MPPYSTPTVTTAEVTTTDAATVEAAAHAVSAAGVLRDWRDDRVHQGGRDADHDQAAQQDQTGAGPTTRTKRREEAGAQDSRRDSAED